MITYLLFIIFIAAFFAQVEIQIEGDAGWAKNLPTWRIENHWALKVFWGGRPMTGYHFWVMLFILTLFHLPYFFVTEWGWAQEMRVLGGLILFWAIEDFLWFVMNKNFGIRKFKKEFIPWHPRWILGLPVDYWIFFPVGIYFVYVGTRV